MFFASLYLVSVGTGGVKSALLPFGADQYNDSNLEESKQKQSFFSLFFIVVNLECSSPALLLSGYSKMLLGLLDLESPQYALLLPRLPFLLEHQSIGFNFQVEAHSRVS